MRGRRKTHLLTLGFHSNHGKQPGGEIHVQLVRAKVHPLIYLCLHAQPGTPEKVIIVASRKLGPPLLKTLERTRVSTCIRVRKRRRCGSGDPEAGPTLQAHESHSLLVRTKGHDWRQRHVRSQSANTRFHTSSSLSLAAALLLSHKKSEFSS